MMYEMLLGVKDIHDHELVHLDLKPSNLLIDNNGFLKIADFGVSVQLPAVSLFFSCYYNNNHVMYFLF